MAQCKFMRETYNRLSVGSIARIEEGLNQLQNMNRIYLKHFEEKLGQTDLKDSKSLENLVQSFVS